MTRAEIERRIGQGGDAKTLWEGLYLLPAETAELRDHVKAAAVDPRVYLDGRSRGPHRRETRR